MYVAATRAVIFLLLQLKLVQHYLSKNSCMSVMKKSPAPLPFCRGGQVLSQLCLVELTYTKILIV